jgi:hypothetical protein
MLSYSSQVSWILMTVRLNKAFWLVPFTVRDNPPGLVAKVSTTVLGDPVGRWWLRKARRSRWPSAGRSGSSGRSIR